MSFSDIKIFFSSSLLCIKKTAARKIICIFVSFFRIYMQNTFEMEQPMQKKNNECFKYIDSKLHWFSLL